MSTAGQRVAHIAEVASYPPIIETSTGDIDIDLNEEAEQLYVDIMDQGQVGTDLGLAYMFETLYADRLRYCADRKCWYVWNARRWEIDREQVAMRYVRDMLAQMLKLKVLHAGDRASDGYRLGLWAPVDPSKAEGAEPGERVSKSKRSSDNFGARTIRDVLTLSESNGQIAIKPEQLDTHPHLINALNGTIDLARTGLLRTPSPKDLLTQEATVPYGEHEDCPQFLKFLRWATCEDEDLLMYVQRALGSALIGDNREQAIYILFGPGGNGKSTLMHLISRVLGDYALAADKTLIAAQKQRGVPADVARLNMARLVTISEWGRDDRLDEARVKELTGGEPTVARFLYEGFFQFVPKFKIFLTTNSLPQIETGPEGDGYAIWRRIRPIPFMADGREITVDRTLGHRLYAEEGVGILNWLVEGAVEYLAEGLGTCPAVKQAMQYYQAETDPLTQWLQEDVEIGAELSAPATALYQRYVAYCAVCRVKPLTLTAFGRALTAKGFPTRAGGTCRYRDGLALR